MDHDKLRVLSRPFSDIKTRPGRNGQELSYIEGHAVVQRLNEAFDGDWSFKVLSHEVQQTEVVVVGELRAGDLVKQAFGGSELTRTRDGKVVSVADDLKSAATDSLKKAATLLGVGLHLYGADDVPEDKPVPTGPRLVHSAPVETELNLPVNNRLTRKQAEFIDKLGRNRGLDRAELEALALDRYGRQCAYLTVQQASDFIKLLGKAA